MHFSCHKSNKETKRKSIFQQKFIANRTNTFNSKYFLSHLNLKAKKNCVPFKSREKSERIFRRLNWGSDNNRLLKLKAHVKSEYKKVYTYVRTCYMHSLFRVKFFFILSIHRVFNGPEHAPLGEICTVH